MSGQDLKVMLRRIESGAMSDDDVLSELDVASVVRDLMRRRARVAELEAERGRVLEVMHDGPDIPGDDPVEMVRALGLFYIHAVQELQKAEARTHAPGNERFAADNGDGERDTFDTLDEAREFATQAINNWRSEADDHEWPDSVEGVTVWVAIERAAAIPMVKRYPDDRDSCDYVLKPLPRKGKEGGA